MVIEETIAINAPLPLVWQVFSSLEDWQDWNSVCRNCCLVEGEKMGQGACFAFTLRPYRLPIKITPKIIRWEPNQEVIWAGKRLGIYAEHSFLFREQGKGVVLTSLEKFSGPLFWLCRIGFVPSRLHRLTRQLLEEIKQQAESRWPGGGAG